MMNGTPQFTTARLACHTRPGFDLSQIPDPPGKVPPPPEPVVAAIRRERQRIGQELHDGVAQQFSAAAFAARIALEQSSSTAPQLEKCLAEVIDLIDEGLRQIADLSRGLAPLWLKGSLLGIALHKLAARTTMNTTVTCAFEACGDFSPIGRDPALHIFRIVQEALQNALRHADASEIRINLRIEEEKLNLEIRDNGAGCSLVENSGEGLGLFSIRERCRMMNGGCTFTTAPGAGMVVACRIPLLPDA